MSDPHQTILEHFFTFIDRGVAPEATPIFTGIHEGEWLCHILALEFRLSPQEAEAAIETARREVAL
jgi:hypothetical protein